MSDITLPEPVSPAARIAEIRARMEQMQETLEGCDWCCGGGDEEWAELVEELRQLGVELQ